MSSEEKETCDTQSCQLCLLKFSTNNDYQDHCNSIKHIVRVLYLNSIEDFERKDFFKYELIGSNNIQDNPNTSLKLKFQRGANGEATVKATNIAKANVEVVEVVNVNSHQKDIQINTNFDKRKVLGHGEDFRIVIKGYFHNSALFTLPIVVVCRLDTEQKMKYFLQEMIIEVASEYSSLKSGIPYHKPIKLMVLEKYEEIIRESKVVCTTNYREKYPLKQYRIPTELQLNINNLIRKYPFFIEKFVPDKAEYLYNTCAAFLNVHPILIESNYFKLLDTLVNIEENQISVDVRDYDTMSMLTSIRGNTYDLKVPGLAEARPSLIVHDTVFVKEEENDYHKFQGRVTSVFENSVRLNFSRKFTKIYNNKKLYHIEFGYNRRTLKVQKQALFLAREHGIISYLYPKEDKRDVKQTVEKITYFNPNLNEEQQRAVVNILKKRSAPYLIFGPPGTGKTVTIVESVLQVWKNHPQARILVCAPSNSATNEIAIRLLKELSNTTDLFRLVGHIYGKDKTHIEIKDIVNILKDGSFFMPSMEKLLSYRVLLTTLATAARLVNGGTPDGHYSYVFIDEAGYATESESLIPIAGILSNSLNKGKVAGQIVLAGDPKQLGPVVQSNFVKFCGYGTSMLERLIDTCKIYARDESNAIAYNERYVTKLLRNYRSHKEILNIPNRLFYHNELIPVGSASSDLFTNWEYLMTAGFPVIFHHIVGEDGREEKSPSFFNIQEIEEVMIYAQKLVGSRVNGYRISQDDVGIITPYRKQAQKLRQACERKGWDDILVGSVEQFQGKEKLVIIISTVRSKNVNKFREIDKKCQLGFVSNAKRFNVALTRAKALLIVVGNGDVLKTDKNWCHFIEYCVNNNSVRGKPFHLNDYDYLEEEIHNSF